MEEKISNGDPTYNRCSNIDIPSQLDPWEGDCSFTPQINISNDPSSQVQYAQMSMDEKLLTELQSIGLYQEIVPDLAEEKDEVFSEEISQLERKFCEEVQKKNVCLDRIWKPVEEEKDVEDRPTGAA